MPPRKKATVRTLPSISNPVAMLDNYVAATIAYTAYMQAHAEFSSKFAAAAHVVMPETHKYAERELMQRVVDAAREVERNE